MRGTWKVGRHGSWPNDAPPICKLAAHAGLTHVPNESSLCPPNPGPVSDTDSLWEALPLEPQGIKTKLETGLLSFSPTAYVFMKSLHELESIVQDFPHLLITLNPPPTKCSFSFLPLTKVPDLHKQSYRFLCSQSWPSLHFGLNSPSGHFVSSRDTDSWSACTLQGTCLSPCLCFTHRVDLSNHLIIVSLPII